VGSTAKLASRTADRRTTYAQAVDGMAERPIAVLGRIRVEHRQRHLGAKKRRECNKTKIAGGRNVGRA